MVKMQVHRVGVDPQRRVPFVLLADEDVHRLLPIYIGSFEASAIATQMQGPDFPRPLTHELLRAVMEALGGRLDHVAVTALADSTFYATLHVEANGRLLEIDARPSDAIALALRTGAAILVAEEVLQQAQVLYNELPPSSERAEEVGRLRELLGDLSADAELLDGEDLEE
jgi:bifunctional DNase/RNase